MRIVSAWCKRIISEPPSLTEAPTTHGICPRCYEEQVAALDRIKPDHDGEHGGEGG